jgi:hypothetical protein
MKTLPASSPEPATTNTTIAQTAESPDMPDPVPIETSATQTQETEGILPTTALSKPTPPSNLNRSETEAIGPATDTPAANPDNTNGPVVAIMLLLTTGARHPYKIDEKYLKKRNVDVEGMDPYNIGVYTLKELIWRDWREGQYTGPLLKDLQILPQC